MRDKIGLIRVNLYANIPKMLKYPNEDFDFDVESIKMYMLMNKKYAQKIEELRNSGQLLKMMSK